MGVGRVFCVALPFILTASSLICLLVVTLAGVTDNNLYMFRVNTTDLEFNPTDLDRIGDFLPGRSVVDRDTIIKRESLPVTYEPFNLRKRDNITLADLGFSTLFDVSLWGYCETDLDGDRTCIETRFDWANQVTDDIVEQFQKTAAIAGQEVVLPDAIDGALRVFSIVTKWTEIAYIAALISLGVELFFGIFATCSRAWSCVTVIVAGVATVLVFTAVSLSTAMSVVVVGAVESTARWYGVRGNLNITFLVVAWLAASFALGAGLFWTFTVCCCANSHHSYKRGFKARSIAESEKPLPAGTYQPLGEQHEMTPAPFYRAGQKSGNDRQSVGPRTDMAYEPYSHSRV